MNTILYIIVALAATFVIYIIFSYLKMKNTPAAAESDKIINLNDKNFQQTTKNSVALVDFWAEWCMPCKMMTPVLNEVANEVDGNVKICKINVDEQRNLAAKYSVRSIPTLILLKNGKEIDRFVGVKQKGFLLDQIQKHSNN